MRKVPRNEEELIIKQNSDLFTRKFKRKLRKALLSIKNPPLLKRCTNVFTRVVKCKTFSLLISVINNLHLSQKIQVFTLWWIGTLAGGYSEYLPGWQKSNFNDKEWACCWGVRSKGKFSSGLLLATLYMHAKWNAIKIFIPRGPMAWDRSQLTT